MCDVLYIHTHQYNKCSTPCEAPEMAALPPLVETQEYPRRLYHEHSSRWRDPLVKGSDGNGRETA
ncbi:hypothetical protein KSD_73120 [Ktedonobacter sp. SOSP1-85]|nr:hypothetical protein KSD_73120 [Ktedonobacter sp. SOSP1-85]